MPAKFIYPDLPDDKTLKLIGAIAVRHSHMELALRMTIKSLIGVAPEEAMDATEDDKSYELRDRVKKLGRRRLGDGEPLIKLQALVTRAKRATDDRNQIVHSIVAKMLDGPVVMRDRAGIYVEIPAEAELEAMANRMAEISEALHAARQPDGWLGIALAQKA